MINDSIDRLKVAVADELFDMIRGVDNKPIDNLNFGLRLNEAIFNTPDRKDALKKARLSFDRSLNYNFFNTIKQIIEHPILTKKHGEVFTPSSLVNSMLDKLPAEVWSNREYKWLDNSCGSGHFLVEIKNRLMISLKDVIEDADERESHILQNMIYGVDIQYKNIYLSLYQLDKDFKYNIYEQNISQHNALTFNYWNDKKFDIIVGNPPYNDSSRSKLGGKTLWDSFVIKSLEILNDSGYLLYVHPSLWRNPENKLYKYFKYNNLIYLNINSYKEGAKVFGGKGTNFDWYLLQKNIYQGVTEVCDIDNKVHILNISEWSWLPNGMFDTFEKIIAKQNEQKIEILHSWSAYESRKNYISKIENNVNRYPCVYYINKDSSASYIWSSDNSFGHFGVPKIIYASGDGSLKGQYVYDKNGEFGMSQFAFGIIDSVKNLDSLSKILSSSNFKKLIEYMVISKNEFNRKAFFTFKKDFWKYI
jgi:hypothetical protein